jgi:dolichol-phosphate mannosyltransferase
MAQQVLSSFLRYNEIENIEAIIKAVFAVTILPFHVLIVDDNSPDGTAAKVIEPCRQEFRGTQLFLEVRTKKSGLGTAYVAWF